MSILYEQLKLISGESSQSLPYRKFPIVVSKWFVLLINSNIDKYILLW